VATGTRTSTQELLATRAMYCAKWDGKNGYVVFESGMQDEVHKRMELEMDLRDAIENDEFFLVLQPAFDLQDHAPGRSAGARSNTPHEASCSPTTSYRWWRRRG
jgi:predicted signal transduction protein with EAL and GGDEF domain